MRTVPRTYNGREGGDARHTNQALRRSIHHIAAVVFCSRGRDFHGLLPTAWLQLDTDIPRAAVSSTRRSLDRTCICWIG